MKTIAELVDVLRHTDDCSVLPPCGLPALGTKHVLAPSFLPVYDAQPALNLSRHVLPSDLRDFYAVCGGAVVYEHASCPWYIVPPTHCVLANPVLVPGWDVEQVRRSEGDRSWSWYVVAQDQPHQPYEAAVQTITIDLDPNRLGRCYDSFWDRHATVGYCDVVATSFAGFLAQALAAKGSSLFWIEPGFQRIGDAYADG